MRTPTARRQHSGPPGLPLTVHRHTSPQQSKGSGGGGSPRARPSPPATLQLPECLLDGVLRGGKTVRHQDTVTAGSPMLSVPSANLLHHPRTCTAHGSSRPRHSSLACRRHLCSRRALSPAPCKLRMAALSEGPFPTPLCTHILMSSCLVPGQDLHPVLTT